MFPLQEIEKIRDAVASVIPHPYAGQVTVTEGPGLQVTGDGQRAQITAESQCALARGFFRLAQETFFGRVPVQIREEKQKRRDQGSAHHPFVRRRKNLYLH